MIYTVTAIVLSIMTFSLISGLIFLNNDWPYDQEFLKSGESRLEDNLDNNNPSSINKIGEQSGTQISASGSLVDKNTDYAIESAGGLDTIKIHFYRNRPALLGYLYNQSRLNSHKNGIRAPTA
ncbi:MAG: hypothetical protein COY66_01830 [Candidatus Kerfeldbacteria bacterium CG_4_10_14_0_8_um_filter_42_10]|uniref:Uncharacterized protein n=1 Tax=Candidatus Kerfeldbacteria bacterium CG_4_10_14_0_8_um_filter_42_10 TaxID=2014248 RepID=A0A2M7RJN8_9BACT|nr:MAG: hypothetical protein COY66_01830 [Candidatus Kerfeldbacteria bacterium CG_4_10_14_0_8_um_filter_42_10]